MTHARGMAVALVLALAGTAPAQALDKFRLANGGFGLWAVEASRIGQQAGIFAKHGVEVEAFSSAGAGETLQAVIAGSADGSIGIGTAGVLGAFQKGAPVRIFGSNFIGAGDLFYYVRAASPIRTFSDTTAAHTVGYSSNGSSSHMTTLAVIEEGGVKAKATATGEQANTLTQVLSGQIDIGFGVPPFGLREMDEGKIRIIGTGNEAPTLRTQSVRVDMVSLRTMTERREPFLRFVKAHRETLDWMMKDPQAITLWSKNTGAPENILRRAAFEFQPRSAAEHLEVKGLDGLMAAAVRQKFLTKPLTEAELRELVQVPGM